MQVGNPKREPFSELESTKFSATRRRRSNLQSRPLSSMGVKGSRKRRQDRQIRRMFHPEVQIPRIYRAQYLFSLHSFHSSSDKVALHIQSPPLLASHTRLPIRFETCASSRSHKTNTNAPHHTTPHHYYTTSKRWRWCWYWWPHRIDRTSRHSEWLTCLPYLYLL